MLSKTLEKALLEQVSNEAYASTFYLSMASWMDVNGFQGTASFLYNQSNEDRMHMLKIFHYINHQGGHALVPAIKEPPHQFKDFINCFKQVLEHEQFVTASIHKLVDLAVKEKDHSTHHFLQWYVAEQMEEEAQVKGILDKIRIIGKDGSGMYLLDRDLGAIAPKATDAGTEAGA